MERIYNAVSTGLVWLIEFSVLLLDFIGVCVLLYAVGRGVYQLCRGKKHVRLMLAEGIALSLEFKMGGELLRTSLVRDWRELLILGAIILLRAAMTFLIQWEIRIEKKNREMTLPEEVKTEKREATADESDTDD